MTYENDAQEAVERKAWLSTHDWGVTLRPKNSNNTLVCDLELMKAVRDWFNVQIARMEKGK